MNPAPPVMAMRARAGGRRLRGGWTAWGRTCHYVRASRGRTSPASAAPRGRLWTLRRIRSSCLRRSRRRHGSCDRPTVAPTVRSRVRAIGRHPTGSTSRRRAARPPPTPRRFPPVSRHRLAVQHPLQAVAQPAAEDFLAQGQHQRGPGVGADAAQFFGLGAAEAVDRRDGRRNVAVVHLQAELVAVQQVGDVRRPRPEVEHRLGRRHRAVDLARVDDPRHLLAQRHDVDVGCRQRIPQFAQRLVRQRQHVPQPVLAGEGLHLPFVRPAADEDEPHVGVVAEMLRGFQQRPQRVGEAVVPAVHDDELAAQPVAGAERVLARLDGVDVVLVRPRGHHQHLVAQRLALLRAAGP